MPSRTRIPVVVATALLASVSVLASCGKVSAGYLPMNQSEPRSSLFADDDSPGMSSAAPVSSLAPTDQPRFEEPAPYRDQPAGPLAGRAGLSVCFALFGGRQNSSRGAGSTNHDSGSSGQPLGCLIAVPAPTPAGSGAAFVDPSAFAPTSLASRLFRPPRLA